jgi:hypothetical protein
MNLIKINKDFVIKKLFLFDASYQIIKMTRLDDDRSDESEHLLMLS